MTTKIEALLQVDPVHRQNIIDGWGDGEDFRVSSRKTSLNLSHENAVLIDFLLSFSEDDQLFEVAGGSQSQIINNLLQLGFEKMKDLLCDVVDKTPDRLVFQSRQLSRVSFADPAFSDPARLNSLSQRFDLLYRDRLLAETEIQIEMAEAKVFD